MAEPRLYQSTTENIEDVIFTVGSPYIYWTPYLVTVPDLTPSDIVRITARAEVTNVWPFAVMVGRYICIGECYGGAEPEWVGLPPNVEDMPAPAGSEGHQAIEVEAVDTGRTGTVEYALCLYAASTAMTPAQNYLVLEKGCGGIEVVVTGAETAAPTT